MPDYLVSDWREQPASGGGPARIGTLKNGLTFVQIGPNIPDGGGDVSPGAANTAENCVRRYFGQIYAGTRADGGTTNGAIRPFDEGGTNDWHATEADKTAKGGSGVAALAGVIANTVPTLCEVLTEDRSYLVAVQNNAASRPSFWRYNPDTDTWDLFIAPIPGTFSGQPAVFVHDGMVFVCPSGALNGQNVRSFDPVTGLIVTYPSFSLGSTPRSAVFFSIHDRLFLAASGISDSLAEDSANGSVAELAFGVWTNSGLQTLMGTGTVGTDTQKMGAFRISDNRVVLIGHGVARNSQLSTEFGGLIAVSIGTVGDTKSGALELKDTIPNTTNAMIPLSLRPRFATYGTGGGVLDNMRVFCTTVTDDPTGTIRRFLYFMPEADATATVVSLFEVFDDVTPISLVNQTPEADSNFAFPVAFYGGGALSGGIDGSTRYVSAQARGWTAGNTGVRVLLSAHGDGTVVAHRGIALVFTPGENVTWAGGSGTLIGDGAAEGLYLRNIVGSPPAQDAVLTGGTSGATATTNGVLLHGTITGALFQVAETITGGTSGATAPITHLGLGGAGEQLVKVGAVTGGPFVSGETITGGTSLAVATLSSAPLGHHGGAADKTVRARFHNSAGPVGKGVPSGFCTFVAGTGVGCVVSKGSGPGGSDELTSVIAEGAIGDTPISAEWDFLANGVSSGLVSQLMFEIDRT